MQRRRAGFPLRFAFRSCFAAQHTHTCTHTSDRCTITESENTISSGRQLPSQRKRTQNTYQRRYRLLNRAAEPVRHETRSFRRDECLRRPAA